MNTAAGYVEPSGMYFSEYSDPARFLQRYRFWGDSDYALTNSGVSPGWSGGYQFHTTSLSDYHFNPFLAVGFTKTSESAERFLYYYFNEYLNRHRSESVSGMLSWMAEREPLAWRYHDLGPSGNYSRKYLRSVSYPFDGPPMYSGATWVNRTGIFSFGWEDGVGGADKIFDDSTKSLLPHYQLSSLVNQIQSCFEYMFQNPHINSGHPTPDLHLIAGLPSPQLPKHVSLQLNHLNLKPTGWLESQPNVLSVIPNSGYYPFLDRVRQINYPLQYLRNVAAIINVSGHNEYRDPANLSLSGTLLNRPNRDVLRCLLHFGLLKNAPINVQFSGGPQTYTQFAATTRDRFGNTDSSLLYYEYRPTFSYFLIPHLTSMYSGYFPPQVYSGTFSLPYNLDLTITGIPATFGFSTDPIESSHVYQNLPATRERNQAPFGGDYDSIVGSILPDNLLYGQGNSVGVDYIFDINTSWCLHAVSGGTDTYRFSKFVNVPDGTANLNASDFSISINGISIPIDSLAGYKVWAPSVNSRATASGSLATICSRINNTGWFVRSGYYDVDYTAQYQLVELVERWPSSPMNPTVPGPIRTIHSGIFFSYMDNGDLRNTLKNSIPENVWGAVGVPASSVYSKLPSNFRTTPTGVWTSFNGTYRSPSSTPVSNQLGIGDFNAYQNLWLVGDADRDFGYSNPSSSEGPDDISFRNLLNNQSGCKFTVNSINFTLYVSKVSGVFTYDSFSGRPGGTVQALDSGTSVGGAGGPIIFNMGTWSVPNFSSGQLTNFPSAASSWWN